MKQSSYKIWKVSPGGLHVFRFGVLRVGLLATVSCVVQL